MLKSCEWDKKEFEARFPNQRYCSNKCRSEAKLEKKRIWQNKYDKRTEVKIKRRSNKKGTFDLPDFQYTKIDIPSYLGVSIPYFEWFKEYEVIQNLKKLHKTRPLNEEKYYFTTENDDFSITLLLENPPPCPICGEQLQEKDLTRCELVCRNPDCTGHENTPEEGFEGLGGLVLRGTHHGICYPEGKAKMAFTSQDIAKAQWTKGADEELTTQMVAWSNYWQNK